ncbi:Ger(x)C family spore germination protein [Paenibacillus lautus]|uniref:Ger(x)C family spore germination protein n=1 Tax=Paenibacillus lautus TaxID=1401 RepID=UPI001C7E03A3|nr:Ger(x)C family spore germination protein [Paenibacillus lautus]MBX4149106.1 Ger(x)C family spore germination protein [Paenibacillus lautus]
MRRTIIICFVCATFILLTGCWDRRETNDLAIITGVGLDINKEGEIEVTVEIYSPGGSIGGGGGSQEDESKTVLRTGRGVSIPEAIEDLNKKLSREIIWNHTEVIVINKKFAEMGIRDELDFFVRHTEPRLRSYVFISEGNTKDIMALRPPLERNSSEVLIKLAESEVLMKVTLFELVEMLKEESGASILPLIDKLPPEKGRQPLETIAYINRSAVLKQGKMIGSINDQITRGVLWFRDEIKESIVTVKPEEADGFISMNLIKGRTDLIPKMDGYQLKMTVKVVTVDDVIQNQTNWDLNKVEELKMLEKELVKKIEKRLTDTLEKVQKEMKADVIGFAEEFRRKHPEQWKEIKEEWEGKFPTVEVTFDIEAKILRTGKGRIS